MFLQLELKRLGHKSQIHGFLLLSTCSHSSLEVTSTGFDLTAGKNRGHKPSESPGCLSKDRHPVSGAAQTGSVDSETSGHHEDERRWNGWFTVRCWRRAGSGSAWEKGMLHTLPGEGPEVGGVDSQSVGGSLKLLFDFSRTQVVLQFERALGSGLMY